MDLVDYPRPEHAAGKRRNMETGLSPYYNNIANTQSSPSLEAMVQPRKYPFKFDSLTFFLQPTTPEEHWSATSTSMVILTTGNLISLRFNLILIKLTTIIIISKPTSLLQERRT